MNNSLIDLTLKEVAAEYRVGILAWMKANRPDKWGKMLTLERRINGMVLTNNIGGLKKALDSYKKLFSGKGQRNLCKEPMGTDWEDQGLLEWP